MKTGGWACPCCTSFHQGTQCHCHHAEAEVSNGVDQWLYDKARLVNSALMAKIHTVEWTPAVIANPVTERAMYANWWGLLGQPVRRDKYQAEARARFRKIWPKPTPSSKPFSALTRPLG
jgi:hypothetical protein